MGNVIDYRFCRSSDELTDVEILEVNALLAQLSGKASAVSAEHLREAIRHSRFLVARDMGAPHGKERIVGIALLIPMWTTTRRTGYIEHVVVDEAYRGCGIGRDLVLELIEEARRLGLSRIDLTSRPSRVAANKLYEKLAFKKRETNVFRLDLQ